MKHRLLYNQRSPLVVRRENAALRHFKTTRGSSPVFLRMSRHQPSLYFTAMNFVTRCSFLCRWPWRRGQPSLTVRLKRSEARLNIGSRGKVVIDPNLSVKPPHWFAVKETPPPLCSVFQAPAKTTKQQKGLRLKSPFGASVKNNKSPNSRPLTEVSRNRATLRAWEKPKNRKEYSQKSSF